MRSSMRAGAPRVSLGRVGSGTPSVLHQMQMWQRILLTMVLLPAFGQTVWSQWAAALGHVSVKTSESSAVVPRRDLLSDGAGWWQNADGAKAGDLYPCVSTKFEPICVQVGSNRAQGPAALGPDNIAAAVMSADGTERIERQRAPLSIFGRWLSFANTCEARLFDANYLGHWERSLGKHQFATHLDWNSVVEGECPGSNRDVETWIKQNYDSCKQKIPEEKAFGCHKPTGSVHPVCERLLDSERSAAAGVTDPSPDVRRVFTFQNSAWAQDSWLVGTRKDASELCVGLQKRREMTLKGEFGQKKKQSAATLRLSGHNQNVAALQKAATACRASGPAVHARFETDDQQQYVRSQTDEQQHVQPQTVLLRQIVLRQIVLQQIVLRKEGYCLRSTHAG